ncbi:hypothetical protein E8L90_29360 [Brevibacillus antibioticus]|uniref:Uncharacterized protein n=1 Tax=Brevibacillus antibioticus TaxID=2570228 RepID=A0A4U2YEJ6_9BACL|nr:hypothetical protein [Brevibacillus antibioticus]TKI59180.1 hypothetical protein E8L90_29360 [Brevibacillus antibioticus]
MERLNELNDLLNKLEERHIFYRLSKIRSESIMIEVAVPGQRWEIEIMEDGTMEIEKFISNGEMYDEKELDVLFRDFSD